MFSSAKRRSCAARMRAHMRKVDSPICADACSKKTAVMKKPSFKSLEGLDKARYTELFEALVSSVGIQCKPLRVARQKYG
jgi:hypothetical protein